MQDQTERRTSKMENLENKIKELTTELDKFKDVLENELDKIKESLETKPSKRKKPEKDELYFYLDCENEINDVHWYNDEADIGNFNNYNCFLTREEAEKAQRVKETENMLRRYIEEHDTVVDWNDVNQEKYYLWFDTLNNEVHTDFKYSMNFARTIYASNKQILLGAAKEIGEDRVAEYLQY